jgi:CubicO group peptidase (beta-lactamase class C family)
MRGSLQRAQNPGGELFQRCLWVVVCAGALLTLTACGGGGGSGDAGQTPDAVNTAPVASAGADQTIQLPTNSVQLTGSATDDGLPAGRTLTYAWTSAPAGVTFADATAAATTATFPGEGTFTLTLTVSDGALSDADSLTVVVEPAAGVGNAPPVVDAGADLTIVLPATATLQGSATDDGLPSPTTLTYQWSVAGGAPGVTFADATAAATTASFASAGTYELVLTVSDGALSGTDSLLVTVSGAIYPAADTNEADPDRGWSRVAPAEVGMDAALLVQAQTYAETALGSGMIVKGGQLVHSWGDIDERFDVKSTTKSIGGAALGLAIDEGRIALTDIASNHLPTVGTPPDSNAADWRSRITLLQLATHTAGFEKTGGYGELIYEPGTTWFYSDGGFNWLADVLTTVFAQDLRELLTARVWTDLGVDSAGTSGDDVRWRNNRFRDEARPNGIPHREFASGIFINTNAMARYGLLYLRNGLWSTGRIVSESFVATVQLPRPEVATATNADATNFPAATTGYGVAWWTNAHGQLPEVPRDAYWAWGLGDSLIVVIPSLDLVVARAGPQATTSTPGQRVFGDNDWNGDYEVLAPLLNPIVQAATP